MKSIYELDRITPVIDSALFFDNFNQFMNNVESEYPFVTEVGALKFKLNEYSRFYPVPELGYRISPRKYEITQLANGLFEHKSVGNLSILSKNYKIDAEVTEDIDALERRIWSEIILDGKAALYHHELSPRSKLDTTRFPLGEVLEQITNVYHSPLCKVPGITDIFYYYGHIKSFGCLHLEDYFLRSLNAHRGGAYKIWYFIRPTHFIKLERAIRQLIPCFSGCPEFLRLHKNLLLSPQLLDDLCIDYTRIVQKENEIVLTMEYGAHQIVNCGYNQNIASNCGTRHWLKYGIQAGQCRCDLTTVSFNVDDFCRQFLVAQSKHEQFINDVYQKYSKGLGCILYKGITKPLLLPRWGESVTKQAIPLIYIKVNGYWYRKAKMTATSVQYVCCKNKCNISVILKRDVGYGKYIAGEKGLLHDHEPTFIPSQTEMLQLAEDEQIIIPNDDGNGLSLE